MNFGRTIKIFLSDGSPAGLRHVEIANWSGQALAFPRSRLAQLKNWPEAQRPGVYFLFEKSSNDDSNTAYIGESEDVFKRLANHDRDKDFWTEAVIFTSKDENLTKGHIKFLEAKLTQISRSTDRYKLENSNTPTQSGLPRADTAAMEEFIANIRLVLGSLGHKLLESISNFEPDVEQSTETVSNYKLMFKTSNLVAHGRVTDDGFLLLKGSQLSTKLSQSMPGKSRAIKRKLEEEGKIIPKEGSFELLVDVIISSSSYAASLVAGNSRSGPQSWKTTNGELLKDLEERLLEQQG